MSEAFEQNFSSEQSMASQPPIYAVVWRPSSRALYCVCFLTEHPLSLDPLFRRNLWRLPPSFTQKHGLLFLLEPIISTIHAGALCNRPTIYPSLRSYIQMDYMPSRFPIILSVSSSLATTVTPPYRVKADYAYFRSQTIRTNIYRLCIGHSVHLSI